MKTITINNFYSKTLVWRFANIPISIAFMNFLSKQTPYIFIKTSSIFKTTTLSNQSSFIFFMTRKRTHHTCHMCILHMLAKDDNLSTLLLWTQNLLHFTLLFIRHYYFHNLLPSNTISNKSMKMQKRFQTTFEFHHHVNSIQKKSSNITFFQKTSSKKKLQTIHKNLFYPICM